MKNAVIYARYSSERQTEQSIEGQLRVCKEFADKNNYRVIKTYVDRAVSGKTDNRDDFQRMIRESTKHAFEFIIVYKLDRFADLPVTVTTAQSIKLYLRRTVLKFYPLANKLMTRPKVLFWNLCLKDMQNITRQKYNSVIDDLKRK